MFKFFFTIFFLVVVSGKTHAQQDLNINFSPLKSTGALPVVFTQNIRKVISTEIAQLKDSIYDKKKLTSKFLTLSNYEIEKIIRSGNTLINDEVSNYLNDIANIILNDDPLLRSKISIYAFKSTVVNAYSYDKGYIFVNLGLIAQAETEAQLAFLLCHEIMHYVKEHQINSYINDDFIEKDKTYDNKLIEKCQYSKELEGEADFEGFKLFEKTAYNPTQSLKLLDVLQYSNLPFELIEFKKSFFETPNYTIPSRYFLNEISPIKNNSDNEDINSTHPNTAKRKFLLSEKVKFANKINKQNFILGKEKFEYVRNLARMELCRLYLKNRDYPNALYAAYVLKQKFPNNEYVDEILSKTLYALSLYKNEFIKYNKNSHLNHGLPNYSQIQGFPQQVYSLIDKMPANEFTIMSLNYAYRLNKVYPSNANIKLCSDSLLSLMKKIDWKITNFNRGGIKTEGESDTVPEMISKTDFITKTQKNTSKEDSVYYKNVFLDLFITDKYFSEKFPLVAPAVNSYFKRQKLPTIKKDTIQITNALFLEPFFYKLIKNNGKIEFEYLESDLGQEHLLSTLLSASNKLNLNLITLDPGIMNVTDVEKMNDYSILNDWIAERFDSNADKQVVLNTNEINKIIQNYKTKYVIKTGIVSQSFGIKNKTYFFACIIDINVNKVVYYLYQRFNQKVNVDLVKAKSYELFYNLKNFVSH